MSRRRFCGANAQQTRGRASCLSPSGQPVVEQARGVLTADGTGDMVSSRSDNVTLLAIERERQDGASCSKPPIREFVSLSRYSLTKSDLDDGTFQGPVNQNS